MSQIINADSTNFGQLINESTVPVLVDVWAPWCGPCKAISPILDELATAYDGKLLIVKVNADENKDIVTELGVRGIPALFIFKEGEKVGSKIGSSTRPALAAFIDQHI